jgi:hypothetical protein
MDPERARSDNNSLGARLTRWLGRTPVQTFLLCPLIVVAFEIAWSNGRLTVVTWGLPLLL